MWTRRFILRNVEDEFLTISSKVVDNKSRLGWWRVFDEYQLCGSGAARYIEAPGTAPCDEMVGEEILGENNGRDYQPLVRYPDLFLGFATLADYVLLTDQDLVEKTALAWAKTYGVLGLTPVEGFIGRSQGSAAGGKKDTVQAFAAQAWEATRTLRLYEAATRPDGPDMQSIVDFAPKGWRNFSMSTPAMARQWALHQVQANVQYQVALHCYPVLYPQKGGNFVEGWGFSSLIGAMWLQMFWLLTTRDEPRRCRLWEFRECDRIISPGHLRPRIDPGSKGSNHGMKYVTREDKEFCSDKHRYRYHYLTKVKPQRQAARTH